MTDLERHPLVTCPKCSLEFHAEVIPGADANFDACPHCRTDVLIRFVVGVVVDVQAVDQDSNAMLAAMTANRSLDMSKVPHFT